MKVLVAVLLLILGGVVVTRYEDAKVQDAAESARDRAFVHEAFQREDVCALHGIKEWEKEGKEWEKDPYTRTMFDSDGSKFSALTTPCVIVRDKEIDEYFNTMYAERDVK
jgi:hypothetical protein